MSSCGLYFNKLLVIIFSHELFMYIFYLSKILSQISDLSVETHFKNKITFSQFK